MTQGPLGGPRPFAKHECRPLLRVTIQVDGNRWELTTPEAMNKLVSAISDSTGYIEQNIYLRESQGPAEASDFYAFVQTGTGEFFHSVARSVDAMEERLEDMEGVRDVGTVLTAGDPEKKIRE